jgi:threonyl-tRNA synthetase
MPTYTFPDGSTKPYDVPVSGLRIATDISPGLAKHAIGVKVDDRIQDLGRIIPEDARVTIIKAANDDPDALYLLRHSSAHVMAEAICELFPGTRLAYGPPIEDGFYYDLATPRQLTTEDFAAIEAKMAEIVKQDRPFTRVEFDAEAGLKRVAGDKYKTDNAERALERGSDVLSFYVTGRPGENWEDLCGGPHVPSTKWLEHAKVMSVAGAYWHGDQSSDQLTRVYGTAWADKKGLKGYLQRLEEAKARDHRKIGKELDLFHLEEDNPGQIYWHHRGWTIYRTIEQYIREAIDAEGYIEVKTPNLQPQGLWERSGHWAKYRENMFITFEQDRGVDREQAGEGGPAQAAEQEHGGGRGGEAHGVSVPSDSTGRSGAQPPREEGCNRCFSLKPMNCPGHITIFKTGQKSYRDLPLRMAEFGSCVRYEPSGALHGIMRVRGFVQDDAHIFCTEEQIGDEVTAFCALLKRVYADFGFASESVKVKFSTRPETRVGSDGDWDRAEAALEAACQQAGLAYVVNPGEGAFYGPKLEFTLVDCLGREWQCGTIQVDYQLAGPERLNALYTAEDGSKKNPVILHRAICGSLERFIGILIEHYAGKFPLWLAPEQIRVLPITDEQLPYAREVVARLRAGGIRAEVDEQPDKLGAKIRNARIARVNYFAVVGGQEVESGTVSLQRQNGDKLGTLGVDELIAQLREEIAAKTLPEVAVAGA